MALIDVFGDGSFMAGFWWKPKRLSHPDKAPVSIGSRTIASAEAISGGVRLEFENEWHSYTINTTEFGPGSATEKTFRWKAGGSWPITAHDPKTVNSYTEPNNTVGSPYGAAQPGDCISISGIGIDDWRMVLSYVKPFDGAEAAGWGDTRVVASSLFRIGGFFTPSAANLAVPGAGEHGKMVAPSTGDFVKEGSTVYAWVNQVSRPTLATHQFWYDGDTQEIYFAPANDGAGLTIRYGVMDKAGNYIGTFTESYTVDTDPVTATGIDYSLWIGSVTKSAKYDATGATVSPAPTETDSSGQLMMQFSGNDAGKWIRLLAEESAPADAPSNGVPLLDFPGQPNDDEFHGYLSYARKRDVGEALEESGFLAANVALLPGKTVTFYWSDVVMLPITDVQWYTPGNTPVSIGPIGTDWTANHGTGRVWITDSWLADKPADTEFVVPNAQYIDHRGFLPATVMNKVQAMSDALTWIACPFGASDVSYEAYRNGQWQYEANYFAPGETCSGISELLDTYVETILDTPSGLVTHNFIYTAYTGADAFPLDTEASFDIVSTLLGFSEVFKGVPDGWTIEQAYIPVTSPGASLNYNIYEVPDPSITLVPVLVSHTTSHPDMVYVVIAIRFDGEIEVVGSFPAPPDSHVGTITQVHDCTEVMQAIFARRNDGVTANFGILMSVGAVTAGSLDDMIRGLRPPQAGALYTPPGGCPLAYTPHYEEWRLDFSPPSVGIPWAKWAPAALEATDVITERYPDFSE